jgi:hypothetical protein
MAPVVDIPLEDIATTETLFAANEYAFPAAILNVV